MRVAVPVEAAGSAHLLEAVVEVLCLAFGIVERPSLRQVGMKTRQDRVDGSSEGQEQDFDSLAVEPC